MAPLAALPVAAVATLSGAANAEYFCESLPDQATAHTFRTPLLNADERTVFAGDISYDCNHSSGGVTYLQNLPYTPRHPTPLLLAASRHPQPPRLLRDARRCRCRP